ncbi:MAG: helix-turn-helix domain-containing protein [Deltaproteobacteria bacterium]|nr:helix-turn-helix domain-containing protein [Deltaproteobacteria bacterium]
MPDRSFISTIERGLKILEIFGTAARGLTLTEVADSCQMNKTAASRFLYTFCDLGYLSRDENKRYFLSPKILSIGFGYLNSSSIRSICKPHIDQLSSELNTTANLAILDDTDVIYLYRREVKRYLNYDLYDGSKLPAYCTSPGKVLLAGLKDDELKNRIARMTLEPITRKTITSKEDFWEEMVRTRNRGYAISDRELSMDLCSVAVPLIDGQEMVVASINMTTASDDVKNTFNETVVSKLLEKGRLISKLLGSRKPYPHF